MHLKFLLRPLGLLFLGIFITTAYSQENTPKTSPNGTKNWHEVSHLNILVNDVTDKQARFYLSEDKGFLFILSPRFLEAIILNVKSGMVNSMTKDQITVKKDDFVAVTKEQVQARYLTKFEQTQAAISFMAENKNVKIVSRPHLVGQISPEEIMNHTVAYRQMKTQYQPSREAIEYLSSYEQPITLTVAFGTWCPHCKQLVPTLMKSLEECENSNLSCSYIGINKQFNQPADFFHKNVIKKIPTVIVRQGGIEIGRITGTPEVTMEDDLAAILKGTYAPKEH